MTIRVARPADVEALARIHVASWNAAYRDIMPDDKIARTDLSYRIRDWTRRLANADWPAYLLEEDGKPVGLCHIILDPDVPDGHTGHITSLHILPDVRGRGYGKALLQHALDELRRRGMRDATLWVLERNTAARRFYESVGWQLDGGRKTYPGTEVPEVRYRIAIPHSAFPIPH